MSHRTSQSYHTFSHSIYMWHFLYVKTQVAGFPLQCTTSRHSHNLESCTSEWGETSALPLLKQEYLSWIKLEADHRQFKEKCGRKVPHASSLLSAHKYIVGNFISTKRKVRERSQKWVWVFPHSLGFQPCMRQNLAPACVILMIHLGLARPLHRDMLTWG